ncbi:MAG: Ig-like domain-containing protein [Acidimicrobiales bacterium]
MGTFRHVVGFVAGAGAVVTLAALLQPGVAPTSSGILPTTTSLNASPAATAPGSPVVLKATVSALGLGGLVVTPSGAVTFTESGSSGTEVLGKVSLPTGCLLTVAPCTASLSVTTLPMGVDTIEAAYAGDTLTGPSSAITTVVIYQTWSLTQDLLANLGTATPADPWPDSYGNPGVWAAMSSTTLTRDPSTYSDLPDYFSGVCGATGYDGWGSDAADAPPWATGNTTASTIDGRSGYSGCGPQEVLPAQSAFVHPGSASNVLFAWRSPVTGTIAISGRFAKADCGGGTGIAWYVDLGGTDLANGTVGQCGSSDVPAGLEAHVTAGQFVYFVVAPNPSYLFDATQVDATITLIGT